MQFNELSVIISSIISSSSFFQFIIIILLLNRLFSFSSSEFEKFLIIFFIFKSVNEYPINIIGEFNNEETILEVINIEFLSYSL